MNGRYKRLRVSALTHCCCYWSSGSACACDGQCRRSTSRNAMILRSAPSRLAHSTGGRWTHPRLMPNDVGQAHEASRILPLLLMPPSRRCPAVLWKARLHPFQASSRLVALRQSSGTLPDELFPY